MDIINTWAYSKCVWCHQSDDLTEGPNPIFFDCMFTSILKGAKIRICTVCLHSCLHHGPNFFLIICPNINLCLIRIEQISLQTWKAMAKKNTANFSFSWGKLFYIFLFFFLLIGTNVNVNVNGDHFVICLVFGW